MTNPPVLPSFTQLVVTTLALPWSAEVTQQHRNVLLYVASVLDAYNDTVKIIIDPNPALNDLATAKTALATIRSYYRAVASRASRAVDVAKNQANIDVRDDFEKSGTKTTEAKIASVAAIDERYIEANDANIAASFVSGFVDDLYYSLSEKREAVKEISTNVRADVRAEANV